MRIYYLDNSGFAVLLAGRLLLFDYYNLTPDYPKSGFLGGIVEEEELSRFERVYVFVSHRHYDHFNRKIFDLEKANPHTTYIVDRGVPVPRDLEAVRLTSGETFLDDWIQVRAHPSTDIGISFQVEVEGKTLFFAGDLNCWHWTLDCPIEEEETYRRAYWEALDEIKLHMKEVDVAFFPVDRRMKGQYDEGALAFYQAFHPRLFCPMHFRKDFAAAQAFVKKVSGRVFAPKARGDFYDFDE